MSIATALAPTVAPKFLSKLTHVNFKFENEGTKIIGKDYDAYQ